MTLGDSRLRRDIVEGHLHLFARSTKLLPYRRSILLRRNLIQRLNFSFALRHTPCLEAAPRVST